jgi:hypothetical protein
MRCPRCAGHLHTSDRVARQLQRAQGAARPTHTEPLLLLKLVLALLLLLALLVLVAFLGLLSGLGFRLFLGLARLLGLYRQRQNSSSANTSNCARHSPSARPLQLEPSCCACDRPFWTLSWSPSWESSTFLLCSTTERLFVRIGAGRDDRKHSTRLHGHCVTRTATLQFTASSGQHRTAQKPKFEVCSGLDERLKQWQRKVMTQSHGHQTRPLSARRVAATRRGTQALRHAKESSCRAAFASTHTNPGVGDRLKVEEARGAGPRLFVTGRSARSACVETTRMTD